MSKTQASTNSVFAGPTSGAATPMPCCAKPNYAYGARHTYCTNCGHAKNLPHNVSDYVNPGIVPPYIPYPNPVIYGNQTIC